jgi:hypothetical protein
MRLLQLFCFVFLVARRVVSAVDIARAETLPLLFDYEKAQHGDANQISGSTRECKTFPGDASWPSDETWITLNNTLNDTLLRPAPPASVCYNNTAYNNFAASGCEVPLRDWESKIERQDGFPVKISVE